MKLLFVVNPISGGIDKEPFLMNAKDYCERYGIEYDVFKTTGANDEVNLQKKVKEMQPDKIASVGGDGTTLFTGVAIKGTGIPMGIVPMGSANGMAIELFVDKEPMKALQDIIASHINCALDLILINGKYYCLHIGDVGMNAHIVNKYSKDPKRGMATYAKYFSEEVFSQKPFKYRIKECGKTHQGEAIMLGICNARKFGTGVPLTKHGSPFDGKFELVLIDKIDSASIIRAGLSIFDDRFLENSESNVISCTEAYIEFEDEKLLQLDGEVIGKFKNIQVEILKGVILFISNNDNKYISEKD